MIPLKQRKRGTGLGEFDWTHAPPFFLNPRGILLHRVRDVRTHLADDGMERHHSVHYLCGNGVCFDLFDEDDKFHEKPPKDVLLCARCETMAVKLGEKPADQIAGRHVHRGELRAYRLCCRKKSP